MANLFMLWTEKLEVLKRPDGYSAEEQLVQE